MRNLNQPGNQNLLETKRVMFIIYKTPKGFQGSESNLGSSFLNTSVSNSEISKQHTDSMRRFCCCFPDCDKRYKNKSILKKHERTHFGPVEHVCHFFPCKKKFKSRENLDLHISNSHLNIKPYPCSFCKRVFSHRNGKTYHERTRHLNYFPYGCSIEQCEKKYANKYSLKAHMRVFHGVK